MEMTSENADYIGDGVYIGYDSFGFWLYANDHEDPTDKIYLEPATIEALNRFVKRFEK